MVRILEAATTMKTATPPSAHLQSWLVTLALSLALVLGGGGSPSPLSELMLQLVLAAIVAVWIWFLPAPLGQSAPRGALLIAALILAVPLIQLIPLPPSLWQALPGRKLEQEALALIGREDTWRSLSLAPSRTLAALLAMAPAAALLVMSASLDHHARIRLVQTVLAVGILTLLVGAAQISSGIDGPLRFYEPESNYL